jgi:hypothetical protein
MSIIIGFNPVDYKDEGRKRAQETAIKVLSFAPQPFIPLALGFYDEVENPIVKSYGIKSLNILKRDSQKEIGNTRKLPYVKEMLEVLEKINCDKFGIINSDVLMNYRVFKLLIEDKDAYMFPRYEIADLTAEEFMRGEINIVYDKHPGNDGFFFKKEWWMNNKKYLHNDLILGEADWDNYYRDMIRKKTNSYVEERAIYHVKHKEGWLFKSPGQISNGKIWLDLWESTLEKASMLKPEWVKWEEERLIRVAKLKDKR